jgi:hypothetical protein
MGIFSFISDCAEALRRFFERVVNFVKKIIHRVLNFIKDIVDWFKNQNLKEGEDIPFLIKGDKLKNLIHNAPVVDAGIFKGVYNENSEEIALGEEVCADSLDQKTKEILEKGNENEGLVVLQ